MSFFLNKPTGAGEFVPLPSYIETFTSTEGQTLFTLVNTYDVGMNRINVIVSGVEQFSPMNFTETSSNSITLSEGLPVGTEVIIEIFT